MQELVDKLARYNEVFFTWDVGHDAILTSARFSKKMLFAVTSFVVLLSCIVNIIF